MARIHTPTIVTNWFTEGLWFQRVRDCKAVVYRVGTEHGERYQLKVYRFVMGQYQPVPVCVSESLHRTLTYAKVQAFKLLGEVSNG